MSPLEMQMLTVEIYTKKKYKSMKYCMKNLWHNNNDFVTPIATLCFFVQVEDMCFNPVRLDKLCDES